MRDPYFQAIVKGLEGPLDPTTFESVAVDLLRTEFPTIVPVPGGGDLGVDGAVAVADEPRIQVVCTTAQDVLGNLTRNLKRLRSTGRGRGKALLVTSQKLTGLRRQNLEERARKLGFELVQIYDREAIARRLYREPPLTRELLGITGEPEALTAEPPAGWRSFEDLPLVGREEDLDWLLGSVGDLVVAGEPGAGKTHLLYHVAKDGEGLFLSRGAGQDSVAQATRKYSPRRVLVDDAHEDPDRLRQLLDVRSEIGGELQIVASCWLVDLEQVQAALGGVGDRQTRRLELLTRDQILEIIKSVGVTGPDQLLRELVNQAANKPGLAVTLARECLTGDVESVIKGDRIAGDVLRFLARNVGDEVEGALAAYALGGRAGVTMEAGAQIAGLPLQRLRTVTIRAGQSGVLKELPQRHLAVIPAALRSALIRRVFLAGRATDLSWRERIDLISNRDSGVEALVLAVHHGARMDPTELRELVQSTKSRDAWRFAAALPEHVRWVLEAYPGDVADVAREALVHAPEEATLRLLRSAEDTKDMAQWPAEKPFSILRDWIRDPGPREDARDSLARREHLVRATTMYLQQGGDHAIAVASFRLALSPRFEFARSDPGAGKTVTVGYGFLPRTKFEAVRELWNEVREAVREIGPREWPQLSQLLWDWIHPEVAAPGVKVKDDLLEAARDLARTFLTDLAPLAEGRPGLTEGLRRFAEELGLDLELPEDPVFSTLFPREEIAWTEGEEGEKQLQQAARELAKRWTVLPPVEVARQAAYYEEEAQTIGQTWPRQAREVAAALARQVEEPQVWTATFLRAGLNGDWIEPFLNRLAREKPPGWVDLILESLGTPILAPHAASIVLRLDDPPGQLLDGALEVAGQNPQLAEVMALREEVPLSTLARLLEHPRWETAFCAAIGEWYRDREGGVRKEVEEPWREAVLRARPDQDRGTVRVVKPDFWLRQILRSDSDLAFEWLSRRLEDADQLPHWIDEHGPFEAALQVIDHRQRTVLLGQLTPRRIPIGLLPALIRRDPDLYRVLLSREDLKSHHLDPLSGLPDSEWTKLARLALEAGVPPSEVASAAFLGPAHGWVGGGGEYWGRWKAAFEALTESDPELQEVARIGAELCQQWIDEERKRDRDEELFGY